MKIENFVSFNLQRFDANTQTTTQESMSPEMKTFYDTALLENSRPQLYFSQFAKKQRLPKNHGKTVEFRKANTMPEVTAPLTEGVTPDGSNFGYTNKTVAIDQYGAYSTISDRLELEAIDNTIVDCTEEHAASAGQSLNKLTRNVVVAGTNVNYAGGKTSRSALTGSDKITGALVSKIRTQLVKNLVPKIGNDYIAIIHPSVADDLRHDSEWLAPHQYVDSENIYNGEIGKLHGIRFIEDPTQKVYWGANLASDSRTLTLSAAASAASTVSFDGGTVAASALVGRYVIIGSGKYYVSANTDAALTLKDPIDHSQAASVTADDNTVVYPGEGGAAGIAVYATTFFGKDAFADIEPTAESLEVIVKQRGSSGAADPLDQRSTVGWKASHASIRLYEERLIRLESGSSFSSLDEGN